VLDIRNRNSAIFFVLIEKISQQKEKQLSAKTQNSTKFIKFKPKVIKTSKLASKVDSML
jgi:hypothetical protein